MPLALAVAPSSGVKIAGRGWTVMCKGVLAPSVVVSVSPSFVSLGGGLHVTLMLPGTMAPGGNRKYNLFVPPSLVWSSAAKVVFLPGQETDQEPDF